MVEQEKSASVFFNHDITHTPSCTPSANMSFTKKDQQSPHALADKSSGNLDHSETVPIATVHPDAAVSASKVQQINVIHRDSIVNHGCNDATETECRKEINQSSCRSSPVGHFLHQEEEQQQAQQSEHQHLEVCYEKRQGQEKRSEYESSYLHMDKKTGNHTDQSAVQKLIHHEFVPHEKNEVQAESYPMDTLVNTGNNTGTNRGVDEMNQAHRCMSLALEGQASFTNPNETQPTREPTPGCQVKEGQTGKEVKHSFESLHHLVKGTASADEQEKLQGTQSPMKYSDKKVKVNQQEDIPLKSLEQCRFWKEQLNEANSLKVHHYKKNEDSDTTQQKVSSQGSERDLQSEVSKGQEVKSIFKEHFPEEQIDKQGAEQDNTELVDMKNSEDGLQNQGLEKLSNDELSSLASYPLSHLLTAANFIQESMFTTEKTKVKKTRGPYKKMTKVNFDPSSNPEKPYFCDECNKRFKLRDSLRAHQKQGHTDERPWKCEQCGASFKKKGTLTAHYEVHTNIRPFKCKSCPATFRRQTELNIHYIKHTDIKPFECELCGAAFAWKNSLKHHMKTHSSEKPYECEVCGATFKWPDSLKLHINTHSSVKEFGCDLCNARFKWKRSLRAHKLTHAAIKPFICDLCGSQFVQRAKLKLHMAVHTNEKPFKCEHCDMAFARKDRLNAHKKVHSLHKPFKCPLCDAAFRWDYGLKKHLSIHKKAEEHPCSHCGKTFISIRDAKKHEKSHINSVTYECKECEISFTLQKELNKHNRYAHKTPVRNLRKRKRKKQYVESDSSFEDPEPEMICVEPRVEDLMQMNRDEGTDEEEDVHINNREDDDDEMLMTVDCEAHLKVEESNVKDTERHLRVQNQNYVDVKREVIDESQCVEENKCIKEESLTDEDKDPLPILA
ncbi:uncharacterized protein [Panulirus ornatus]|uniref:uncharacterized protein n=1 Tax=Panulirus ornatus TaxID=150431 RepID=UPI003A8A1E4F